MKVAVAISGGVDSAVTALLLKQKGFNVLGIYMTNWIDDNPQTICQTDQNRESAQIVCNKLDIELKEVNMVKTYWNHVFSYFINGYKSGRTPNPDIMCNKFVKFGSFIDYCTDQLKADAIATGHYAGTSYGNFWQHYSPNRSVRLLKPKDKIKDQTLFLSQISQISLRKVMFPLKHLLKSEVKIIAKQNGLEKIAQKPESQGICFIGKTNFKQFIEQYIEPQIGNFIDVDTGLIVGTHRGIHNWTLGQRCRIGGQKSKYFIVRKIVETNEILVASNTNHKSLLSNRMMTREPNWICSPPKNLSEIEGFECEFRSQNKDQLKPCIVFKSGESLYIKLYEEVRALTDGQFAVLYKEEECLGSAAIDYFWHSDYEFNHKNCTKDPQILNQQLGQQFN